VYYVEVNNSIATALTLSSDTIHYASSSALQQDAIVSSLLNDKNVFSIYPNPAKTIVTVSFNTTGNYVLKLTDVSGNVLQTKTGTALKAGNTTQLNVSKNARGTYFITIINQQHEVQTLKLNKE
jgi:hypothetical protein